MAPEVKLEEIAAGLAGQFLGVDGDGYPRLVTSPGPRFATISALLASTDDAQGAGTLWAGGAAHYLEADSGATNAHVTTSGGVKLYVVPSGGNRYTATAFGATGTGDETNLLKKAITTVASLGAVFVVDGSFLISSEIMLDTLHGWTITGPGTIKMADNAPVTGGYSILRMEKCQNWEISDITVDGNRANRTPSEENGHLIRVIGGGYFTLNRVRAVNGTTDGYYFRGDDHADATTAPSHWTMRDCVADNNYRNGASVIASHHFSISGGDFSNQTGTQPQAGVDIESNANDAIHSITHGEVKNVSFRDNVGYGLQVSGSQSPLSISCRNCFFSDNSQGAISWNAITGEIVSPHVSGVTNASTRGAIDVGAGASPGTGSLLISNATFRNVTVTSTSSPCIYVHSGANPVVTIDGLDIDTAYVVASINQRGARIMNINGVRETTYTVGIVVGGDDMLVSNVIASNFTDRFLYVSGKHATLENIRLSAPKSNSSAGMISIDSSATRATLRNIHLSNPTSVPNYGIRLNTAPRLVENVVFDNFSSKGNALYRRDSALTSDAGYVNVIRNGFPLMGNSIPIASVAGLPTTDQRNRGHMAYALDGRKNGETSGNGTGVLVFFDGTNWIACDTGQTVAA